MKLVVGDFEALAWSQIPGAEHIDDFAAAMAEISSNNEAQIMSGMSATVMFTNIFKGDIGNGPNSFLEVGYVFADELLEARPEQAVIIVHVASELGFYVPFFALKLFIVKARFGDGDLLEVHDAFPFEVRAFTFVTN